MYPLRITGRFPAGDLCSSTCLAQNEQQPSIEVTHPCTGIYSGIRRETLRVTHGDMTGALKNVYPVLFTILVR